ncbi:DUF4292 domain-containing protein [Flavobacterium cyclinae]|uniref:DUF4292 domain-containing protein n=1 Tax=Flavobacterium cyclinae TaxID=2895947 RepID=UPI001E360242|nr:DUF4292 domain-containing protein [Flavobacterium cyclinae]UGS21242.1 DUF4292 domain-containing protein [Flavobacterium cyclinae]
MKSILSAILIVFLIGCKSKQTVATAAANENTDVSKVIKGHYKNEHDFSTLNIRANAKYEDEKQSHSMNADIRIKKDEIIWINIKFLGIPMAKALITPTKVSYYEKINNTYFEGDFSLLSNWLGTDLDFQKVQNLFLGKAIDDLTKDKWVSEIVEKMFKLSLPKNTDVTKEFYFEGANYLIKKETLSQASQNRNLEIQYPSFKEEKGMFLPNEINIKAEQKDKVTIDIEYKHTTFNENLSYPFSIPSGYTAVEIN